MSLKEKINSEMVVAAKAKDSLKLSFGLDLGGKDWLRQRAATAPSTKA